MTDMQNDCDGASEHLDESDTDSRQFDNEMDYEHSFLASDDEIQEDFLPDLQKTVAGLKKGRFSPPPSLPPTPITAIDKNKNSTVSVFDHETLQLLKACEDAVEAVQILQTMK